MSELIDNRAERIRTLQRLIHGLHQGEDPQAVKQQLKTLVRQCDAGEIAAMEQELMAQGVPVQEIMGMCDLHSQVVRELLVERPHAPVVSSHPVDVFRRENKALEQKSRELRQSLAELTASGAADSLVDDTMMRQCRTAFNELMDVDKHYARKENLLFPLLERHGITGPSKVMWGKDDEVRERMNALGDALAEKGTTVGDWKVVVETVAQGALDALEEMIVKEEKILLPMSLQTLNEDEWGEIWSQSPEIGWCLVDPEGEYHPPAETSPEIPQDITERAERQGIALNVPAGVVASTSGSGALVFPTGSLSLDQLEAIFRTMPVDLTFVDAEDRVRFFTEGRDRVFVRPKAVIGRKVQHCHPPASVHIVEEIVGDFRAGRQDVAEFWINLRSRFVHIRYFAVRDGKGEYLGTLEVSQDLTKERELEGERRLLQYD